MGSSQTLRALADAEEEWRSQMLKQVEELQQQVTSGDTSPDTLRALADAQETLQQKDKKRDAPNVHPCVDGVDMTSTTAVSIANSSASSRVIAAAAAAPAPAS